MMMHGARGDFVRNDMEDNQRRSKTFGKTGSIA